MHKAVYRAAVVAAFLGSVAVVTAAEVNLTPQQKQTIMQSVQSEKGQPAPAGFQAKVGATVPQSLSTHQLPSNVTTQVPSAKDLEYAKLDNNQILLIDPKDKRVTDIIMSTGTTGAAPAPNSSAPKSSAPSPTMPAPAAPR
jgi:hypothetical protein